MEKTNNALLCYEFQINNNEGKSYFFLFFVNVCVMLNVLLWDVMKLQVRKIRDIRKVILVIPSPFHAHSQRVDFVIRFFYFILEE